MNIRVTDASVNDVEVDALLVAGFEGKTPAIEEEHVGEVCSSGEFTGKEMEFAVIHRPAGFKTKRLVLAGAGKAEKFNAAELRKLVGAAIRTLKPKGARTIAVALDSDHRGDDFTSAAVEGALIGDFEPDQYKTDPK